MKKLQEYEVGVGMKSTDSVSGNSVVSDCSLFVILYNLHIIASTAGTLTHVAAFCAVWQHYRARFVYLVVLINAGMSKPVGLKIVTVA